MHEFASSTAQPHAVRQLIGQVLESRPKARDAYYN